MKNTLLTLCTLFLFAGSCFAQIDTVSTVQIDKYIGKEVVLKGTLAGYKPHIDKNGKDMMFLDIDERYPNNKISITIFNSAFTQVDISGEDIGRQITVFGLVKEYKDRLRIGVNDARAVNIQ